MALVLEGMSSRQWMRSMGFVLNLVEKVLQATVFIHDTRGVGVWFYRDGCEG